MRLTIRQVETIPIRVPLPRVYRARVCAGQSEYSAGGCRDLMVDSAIDFCNFDSSRSGGPTGSRSSAPLPPRLRASASTSHAASFYNLYGILCSLTCKPSH
ncbi:MAG TPA: hypothetical protein VMS37_01620 [Verrucomicrobiae bacterium]|nr:hypothetical protein [Verrucomicrobiae bacterium]